MRRKGGAGGRMAAEPPHPWRRRGQAMVEMALCLPLLILVLAVTIELSMLISHASTLQEAVNQAARSMAESRCEPETAKARIRSFLASDRLLASEELDVDIEEGVDFNGSPTITIRAGLRLRPFAFSGFGSFRLSAGATYRREW